MYLLAHDGADTSPWPDACCQWLARTVDTRVAEGQPAFAPLADSERDPENLDGYEDAYMTASALWDLLVEADARYGFLLRGSLRIILHLSADVLHAAVAEGLPLEDLGAVLRDSIPPCIAYALGCTQLCPRAPLVTPEIVQRLHAEGFIVRAWGVANEALMRQVVEAGADGMTVNFPDKLLAYMAGRVSPSGKERP